MKNSNSVAKSGGPGKIAIFFWDGYIGVSPSLINGIRVLSEAGYCIDIVTRDSIGFAEAPYFNSRVRIIRLPRLQLPSTVPFRSQLEYLLNTIEPLLFAALGSFSLRANSYLCFIGVDMNGLLSATLIGFVRRVPVLYWSLEIVFSKEFSWMRDLPKRIYKRMEKICHRRAKFTIIQDQARARTLALENGVDCSNFIIVPNSPLGAPPNISSDYFQSRFGLPSGKRIILHAGMIGPETLSLELAQVAASWPNEWSLVLHERAKRDPAEPYLLEIQKKGNDHVLLSLDPVSYDELDFVISSGHIGLVMYNRNLGPNFSLVAGASGKLAQYLRCGLPVVCVGLDSLKETVHGYKCGIVVEDIQQIEGAITTIFSQYDLYRANAVRCYLEIFEFGPYFRNVVLRIQDLVKVF